MVASAIERTAKSAIHPTSPIAYQQRGQLGVKGGLRIYLINSIALGHLGCLSG